MIACHNGVAVESVRIPALPVQPRSFRRRRWGVLTLVRHRLLVANRRVAQIPDSVASKHVTKADVAMVFPWSDETPA
jgi:hypothetical protein